MTVSWKRYMGQNIWCSQLCQKKKIKREWNDHVDNDKTGYNKVMTIVWDSRSMWKWIPGDYKRDGRKT